MTRETFLKKLGKNVTHYREIAGLTQTELGLRLDKDRQSINRLEKGRINMSAFSLYQVARELDISVKELLDFD